MRFSYRAVVPEDTELLNIKECYSVGEVGCVESLIALSMRPSESIAMGFHDGDRLYGILGSYRQWRGAAQLWGLFDVRSEKYPIAMRRTCLTLLSYAVQKQDLRRVSLTVRSDYTKGNRFASSLGFDFEGKMFGYLPDGSDANLYARLF